MKFSTNASQLVAKVGQINMVELAKYGPGKCLGEGIYVIPQLKNYQPYTIKCTSVEAEVLRMSGYEFQRKVLQHS